MTEHNRHAPSPEFRAALEQAITTEWRKHSMLTPPPSVFTRWMRRARSVTLILVGLTLGVGSGFAFGQVQDARVRDSLIRAQSSELRLAQARVEYARAQLERAKQLYEAGVSTHRAYVEAENQLYEMERNLRVLLTDIEEMRATSAPPRRDLTAPRVGDRDFVKQRLEIEAVMLQRQLSAAEEAMKTARQRYEVGAVDSSVLAEAEASLVEAHNALQLHALKLGMRERFLDGEISEARVTQEIELQRLAQQVSEIAKELEISEARAKRAQQRNAVGAVGELEMRAAELEALERRVLLQELQARLRRLEQVARDSTSRRR